MLIVAANGLTIVFAQQATTIGPGVTTALAAGEPVSVIIALWPEEGTSRDSASGAPEPAEIARVQEAVLAGLSDSEFQVSVRYSHIPALSGRLYSAGVEKLAADPRVRRIDLDVGGEGTDNRK